MISFDEYNPYTNNATLYWPKIKSVTYSRQEPYMYMGFAGYVSVCMQLYCVSFHCLTLDVSAYMAIFAAKQNPSGI
jgi:hypothetical protein